MVADELAVEPCLCRVVDHHVVEFARHKRAFRVLRHQCFWCVAHRLPLLNVVSASLRAVIAAVAFCVKIVVNFFREWASVRAFSFVVTALVAEILLAAFTVAHDRLPHFIDRSNEPTINAARAPSERSGIGVPTYAPRRPAGGPAR